MDDTPPCPAWTLLTTLTNFLVLKSQLEGWRVGNVYLGSWRVMGMEKLLKTQSRARYHLLRGPLRACEICIRVGYGASWTFQTPAEVHSFPRLVFNVRVPLSSNCGRSLNSVLVSGRAGGAYVEVIRHLSVEIPPTYGVPQNAKVYPS